MGPINNIPALVQIIETVSAGGRSARAARLGVHPIWWRWHGNTIKLSIDTDLITSFDNHKNSFLVFRLLDAYCCKYIDEKQLW